MEIVGWAVIGTAIVTLCLVAVHDLRYRLIPNAIIYPAGVVLLLLAPFWTALGRPRTVVGLDGVVGSAVNSWAAGLVGFGLFLLIFLVASWICKRKAMGFGDVKLAGVLGLLVGLPGIMVALWIGAVVAGLVAGALVVVGKARRQAALPYAPFLVLGAIVALLAES